MTDTILASSDGAFKAATALYASSGGAWHEVTLGGSLPVVSLEWLGQGAGSPVAGNDCLQATVTMNGEPVPAAVVTLYGSLRADFQYPQRIACFSGSANVAGVINITPAMITTGSQYEPLMPGGHFMAATYEASVAAGTQLEQFSNAVEPDIGEISYTSGDLAEEITVVTYAPYNTQYSTQLDRILARTPPQCSYAHGSGAYYADLHVHRFGTRFTAPPLRPGWSGSLTHLKAASNAANTSAAGVFVWVPPPAVGLERYSVETTLLLSVPDAGNTGALPIPFDSAAWSSGWGVSSHDSTQGEWSNHDSGLTSLVFYGLATHV